jgi:hypothetical protein
MRRNVKSGTTKSSVVADFQIFGTTASTSNSTGALIVSGGAGIGGALYAASLQNTPVGNTTANSGAFTTLSTSSTVTMSATTANIAIGSGQTTGTLTLGGTAQTGTLTFDQSASAHTLNLGTGTNASGVTKTINIGTGGASGSTTNITLMPATAGAVTIAGTAASTTTTSGALVVTGGVGVGGQLTAATIVETSSITVKENINPINNALDSVMKLSGVTYDRIDTKESESGLIAEWVNDVLPNLVTKNESGDVIGIKYTKLTAYLIEAIKSLKMEIDELKSR